MKSHKSSGNNNRLTIKSIVKKELKIYNEGKQRESPIIKVNERCNRDKRGLKEKVEQIKKERITSKRVDH